MLNNLIIMGRLTHNPELRHTPAGVAVTSFTMAVDRDVKGPNGERETDFIDVVAWRSTAEFAEKYFTKGSMVVASGRLQIRNYTDKNGNKRKAAELIASSVYFAEPKRENEPAYTAPPAQVREDEDYDTSYMDDLPY